MGYSLGGRNRVRHDLATKTTTKCLFSGHVSCSLVFSIINNALLIFGLSASLSIYCIQTCLPSTPINLPWNSQVVMIYLEKANGQKCRNQLTLTSEKENALSPSECTSLTNGHERTQCKKKFDKRVCTGSIHSRTLLHRVRNPGHPARKTTWKKTETSWLTALRNTRPVREAVLDCLTLAMLPKIAFA